jgi:hypothetical protein
MEPESLAATLVAAESIIARFLCSDSCDLIAAGFQELQHAAESEDPVCCLLLADIHLFGW